MTVASVHTRSVPESSLRQLQQDGLHPVLARLLAARGIRSAREVSAGLDQLLDPSALLGLPTAVDVLLRAIDRQAGILIVADYDCDGATACAVAVRGLRMLGARVDFLVPNRIEHGYGLSPTIVELALHHPRLQDVAVLVTVDNGIASVAGVAEARRHGLEVVITDHHLAGHQLPAAEAIVNPNQPGCPFGSKALAGVGVMFYVLLAMRRALRERGAFTSGGEPALQTLLDLVALGTVADLVPLDANNRLLVAAGLRRLRAGKGAPGIHALLQVAGREARRLTTSDLGFALGPRINAAGRLADISVGIECLVTDDPARAAQLAQNLDQINRERRTRELSMREQALADVADIDARAPGLVVFREEWHEGIVGLVASRLKDHHHRPTVAFAPSGKDPGLLRGSGRSIPGVHLRDVLDLMSKREPELIERFGGHAMAAGLTLPAAHLGRFTELFRQCVQGFADPTVFQAQQWVDGEIDAGLIDLELVEAIDAQTWGQGFPEPLFCGEFEIGAQRLIKDRHLRFTATLGGRRFTAICFGHATMFGARETLLYRLARDEYCGTPSVQLIVSLPGRL